MSKETVNWNDVEAWKRVVSSILATGVKIDLRAASKFYGTTYDTLENRFRPLKKSAEKLKTEVENGERGEVLAPSRSKSQSGTPQKPKTPKKDPLTTVANGRVTKKATPSSKKKGIKPEPMDDISNSPEAHEDDEEEHGAGAVDASNGDIFGEFSFDYQFT